jgi:hypothetical protein
MHREDLMNADMLSEILLLVSGTVRFGGDGAKASEAADIPNNDRNATKISTRSHRGLNSNFHGHTE